MWFLELEWHVSMEFGMTWHKQIKMNASTN
jgi:hypothetical protein